jgi:hypothetical protein
LRPTTSWTLLKSILTLVILIGSVISVSSGFKGFHTITSLGTVSYGTRNMSWLHTSGRLIVDSDGNIVILRGANFMGYASEYGARYTPWYKHSEEDYKRMASWGFNVVRLPIAWHYIEPKEGFYNESYLSMVDRDIDWAKKYGIYIILDFHQDQWSPHFVWWGSGVPIWAVGLYSPNSEGMGMAMRDFWLGKGPNGTEPSTENPSMQERMVAVWKYLATRYAKEVGVAAYTLLNQPWPSDWVSEGLTADETCEYVYPFYEKLIDEIRSVDQNHIIIYEPVSGSKNFKLLNKPNLVFGFHYYALTEEYSGNMEDLKEHFINYVWNQPKEKPIKDWDIPVYVSEFGIDEGVPNFELWTKHVLSLFDMYSLSYTWWTYFKSDRCRKALLYENGTERLQVNYLDRPYPKARTLKEVYWSFDYANRQFSLVALSEGNHTLHVYVPGRHYSSFNVHLNITMWDQTWNNESRTLIVEFTFTGWSNMNITHSS